MKIVLLDRKTLGNDLDVEEELLKFGELICYEETASHQTLERVQEANIVITNKVHLTQEILEKSHQLKLICITATGTDHVDLTFAKKNKIEVKNVAGYSTQSVAQQTFATLLNLLNHVKNNDDFVKNGSYSDQSLFTNIGEPIEELHGKTIGIIGMGTIGNQVAKIAAAFGMKIQYYSTSGKNHGQNHPSVPLEKLLKTSDIISIHAPLNEKTNNLITAVELQLMKPTALLCNMGRGGIVNENDLAESLLKNKIKGASLDVFKKEPIDKSNPLLNKEISNKLIFSPHIAWASKQARETLWLLTIENIKSFI
jgi:glycerate dehydrogenase